MQHRCKSCRKLLFIGNADGQIKCPRCKQIQHIQSFTTQSADEHQTTGDVHHDSKNQQPVTRLARR